VPLINRTNSFSLYVQETQDFTGANKLKDLHSRENIRHRDNSTSSFNARPQTFNKMKLPLEIKKDYLRVAVGDMIYRKRLAEPPAPKPYRSLQTPVGLRVKFYPGSKS
jgi:hypothetical protein